MRAHFVKWLVEADVTLRVVQGLAGLLVIDIVVLMAALARFQRARLILD